MARCEICGKGKVFGHNVSHSNKKTRRSWAPNILRKKVIIENRTKLVKICAKCYKAGKLSEVVNATR